MPQELDLFFNETAFTQAPAASVADFSQAELSKALAFHRTIPGYAPTPLTALDTAVPAGRAIQPAKAIPSCDPDQARETEPSLLRTSAVATTAV